MEVSQMDRYQNYINGKWVSGQDQIVHSIINPAKNQVMGQAVISSRQDAETAIAAANRSFYHAGSWRNMQIGKRVVLLQNVIREIEEKKDHIACFEAKNQGKPLQQALSDVNAAIQLFRDAVIDAAAPAKKKPAGRNIFFNQVYTARISEPTGVCVGIASWGTPFLTAVQMIAPALAAGNSIIFKPSSLTPVTAVMLFEIFHKCKLPKGCVNLILGPGETVGRHLAQSPNVDLIAFAGSTASGKSAAWSAIKNLKKTNMALSGNSPAIVFEDADLDCAIDCICSGAFYNQGANPWGLPRILVQKSIHLPFIHALIHRVSALSIGDPMDNPDIGAIVSQPHMEYLLNNFQDAEKQGAVCLLGGERYTFGECSKGFFIRPTIFDKCTFDMKLVSEESFGPVLTIQNFRTEKEAIKLANDTDYGTSGAIFTKSENLSLRAAEAIRAGAIWINCYEPLQPASVEGMKMSNHSISFASLNTDAYVAVKHITKSR